MEGQVIGRVFRLGQGKKVCVIRYTVKLARGGGLQSLDEGFQLPKGRQESAYLRRLGKIIESTILTRVPQ